MHPILKERLDGIRKTLIESYNAGKSMSDASKGLEREIFFREFLEKVFPHSARFGTGDIIDSRTNARSGQVDIVIELPLHPSIPLTADGNVRLYMAEGVGAVLEIKSDLRSQWRQVEDKVKKIRSLERQFLSGMGKGWRIPVFAIGYTGYKTVRGLQDRLKRGDSESQPNGALVLDSGIFVYKTPPSYFTSWKAPTETSSGAQALYMLIAIINNVWIDFSSQRPNFDAYSR